MPPLRSREVKTNQQDVVCDVCGRTLLRGERAEPFLHGGSRRQVCELCTARAVHEGWIREAGGDELGVRERTDRDRGRSFLGRLRQRRALMKEAEALEAEEAALAVPDAPAAREEPRHVHAVPTNAEMKMRRAVDVFNASDHRRTVAGVSRSLGPPGVCVKTNEAQPSVVTLTVMWELSWYRFEVDLSDEAGGARRAAQGDELEELPEDERLANAAADEAGHLELLDG